jgi:SAM-dependent methyltransferase
MPVKNPVLLFLPKCLKRLIAKEIEKIAAQEFMRLNVGGKPAVNVVHCCVCGRKSPMFLPFNYRSYVICPLCGSFERHRMVWHYLMKQKAGFGPDFSVLHFSPEQVLYNKFKSLKVRYVPVDIEPTNFPFECKKMDATQLDFPDASIDLIVANHLLEHIPDDVKAMREFHRVLKAGGFALLTVPMKPDQKSTYEDFSIVDPKEREKHFGQVDHVRWYGSDFSDRLRGSGFIVEEIDYSETFNQQEMFKFGFSDEKVFVCRKQT